MMRAQTDREKLYQVDRTPVAVARQGVAILNTLSPRRVVDIGAGDGVFGIACREMWPDAELIAVEPREEERDGLSRIYDTVIVAKAADADIPMADVIIGNPPWRSEWAGIVQAARESLTLFGSLVLLGPSSWGHSDEPSECARLFDEWSPVAQWRIHGRVAFRGGSSADNRKCSYWEWRSGQGGLGSWRTYVLPRLDASERRWTDRDLACPLVAE